MRSDAREKLFQEFVARLKEYGFAVYVPADRDRRYQYGWYVAPDGVDFAYFQVNMDGACSCSSVHIPNKTTGTGFRILESMPRSTPEARAAFCVAPEWASARDRESVHKYKSFDVFRDQHWQELEEV